MKIKWTAHVTLLDSNNKTVLTRDVALYSFTEHNAMEMAQQAAKMLCEDKQADFWVVSIT